MRKPEIEAEIVIADGVAVIRPKHGAQIRANVLGDELKDGVRTVYLDRLVVGHWVNKIGGWDIHGCVSSILTRNLA